MMDRTSKTKVLAGIVLTLFTGVHHMAPQLSLPADQGQPAVQIEAPFSGHSQIGLDERGFAADTARLTFALLGEWLYDPLQPTACPASIRVVDTRTVSITGFMYPLETGNKIKNFCLLRTTQTCCYGPRPQYNQYLFVEMKSPVTFDRLAPVTVRGRFVVDPQPAEGYIYRLEGQSLTSANDDRPDANVEQAARELALPHIDFTLLAGQSKQHTSANLPAVLLALNGQRIVVDGFILSPSEKPTPHLTLALKSWDGKTPATAPTLETALTVFVQTPRELQPVWRPKGAFVGTLEVIQDVHAWPSKGMVCLRNAVRVETALEAATNRRFPIVSVAEGLLWLGFLVWLIKRKKTS